MKKITKILSIAMSVLLVNMLVMPKFDIKAQANEEEKELVPLVVKSDGTYIDGKKTTISGLTVGENLTLEMNNYTFDPNDGYDMIILDAGANDNQFKVNLTGTNTINVVKDFKDYKWEIEILETTVGAIVPFIMGVTNYDGETNTDASIKFVGNENSSLNINLSQATNVEDSAAIYSETIDFENANINIKTPSKTDGVNIGIVAGEGTPYKTSKGFKPMVINNSNIIVNSGEGTGIVGGVLSKGTMDVTNSNVYATTSKCGAVSFLELTSYYSINFGVAARGNMTVGNGAYVYGQSGNALAAVSDDQIASNISAGVSTLRTLNIDKNGVVEGHAGNASTTFDYAISAGVSAIDSAFAGIFGWPEQSNADEVAVVLNGAAVSKSGVAKNVANAQAVVNNGTTTAEIKITDPTGDSVKNKIVDKDGNIIYTQSDTPAAQQLAQSFDLTNEPTEVKDDVSVKLSDLADKAVVKDTEGKTIKDANVMALLADDGDIATLGSDFDTITFKGTGEIKIIFSNVSHRISPNDPLLQTATIKVTSSVTPQPEPQPQPVNPDETNTSVSSSATGDNTINFALALAALAALSCVVVVFSRKRFN